ncbi:hypothetical protein PT287_00290 [Lactobacillus sp. ESL0679]|uniref:hypothetical protein n=1 Tax=Lactobacillus sp. ESL0679 TaxID=2983209 RepID=UPI0023F639B2|nr:hypothetical protein [Lactobacillus sp. ESL0679]MDF7681959.1 hypothetical protein [Lactobacillus sp. ESL0679]
MIDNKSPNELLKIAKKLGRTNDSYLINTLGYLVYLPEKENACLYCMLKRLFFSKFRIYSYRDLWDAKPLSIYKKFNIKNVLDKLETKKASKYIYIINKTNFLFVKSNLISFSDCPICYPNQIHNTSNIALTSRPSIKNENGTRSLELNSSLNKLKELVGVLKPVISFESKQKVDFLNLPVYESCINIDPVENSLEYRFHGGKGQTDKQAICSDIGEAIERYNAQYFNNEKNNSK